MTNCEIIINTVCNHYGEERKNVLSKCRKRKYMIPKQIISFMLLRFTKMSLKAIGEITPDGDHTTAIARIKSARALIDSNESYRNNANYLIAHFSNIFYNDRIKKVEVKPLEAEDIIQTILDYYGYTKEEVLRYCKKRELSDCRQIIAYFLKIYSPGLSNGSVSEILGGRNKSSVPYGRKKVNDLIQTDEVYRNNINALDNIFQSMMNMEIQVAEVA